MLRNTLKNLGKNPGRFSVKNFCITFYNNLHKTFHKLPLFDLNRKDIYIYMCVVCVCACFHLSRELLCFSLKEK